MSQCCGLLRYFVEKVSHLGVNVPHNDMTFYDVITRKASRAECGAACQNDRLSAGLVGRLGGTFNARRREQIMKELEQSDVVIPNTGTTLTPTLSLYKRRGSKVKEILNQVQNDYYKIAAFTLTEVLITLGIIGIVAAMTMPTLVTNFRVKNLKTRFKVADSIIQQAVKKTLNELECDEISDIDVSSTAIIQQNLEELNSIWNRQFTQGARDSSGLRYYYQKIYQYGILGDNKESYFAYKKTNLLPNGVLVSDFSYIWEGGKARLGFWFDTNGPYNGPNRLGHDIFVYYDKDYGDRTSLCNPLVNHSEREKGCYQWARKDVNPIDKSKSYWNILFKPKSYWEKSS